MFIGPENTILKMLSQDYCQKFTHCFNQYDEVSQSFKVPHEASDLAEVRYHNPCGCCIVVSPRSHIAETFGVLKANFEAIRLEKPLKTMSVA